MSVTEGNAETTPAVFTVTLAGPAAGPVTVDYATVSVAVVGDTSVEQTEKFTLTLSNPAGAPLARAQGSGTIVDDDVSTVT